MRTLYVRRALGKGGLDIAVDAMKVQYETKKFIAKERRNRLHSIPFLPHKVKRIAWKAITEAADFRITESELARIPIAVTPVYLRMKDVFKHRTNLRASETYDTIRRDIEQTGVFAHKNYVVKQKDEIETCIRRCFLDMMISMDQSGYLADQKKRLCKRWDRVGLYR